MTKDEAMKLALEALEGALSDDQPYIKKSEKAVEALRQALSQPDPFDRLIRIMGTFDLSTGHADNWTDLLDSLESELRDVLGYYRETFKAERKCSSHPDAPHGFDRDASHNLDRYVCECEGWDPPEQEPVAWPHKWGCRANAFGKCDKGCTAPPKQEFVCSTGLCHYKHWVGLTDEEIAEGAKQSWVDKHAFESAVWWAEGKLKEKNHD